MNQSNGQCLCGAVRFTATLKPGVGACHCDMCRHWCGGPLMSAHAVGDVTFEGEENLTRYASSEWAERGFCSRCGSSLFYYLKPMQALPDGEYILAAGCIDDQSSFSFDHEVYVDHAPAWYAFAGASERKRMTEADIMAMVEQMQQKDA